MENIGSLHSRPRPGAAVAAETGASKRAARPGCSISIETLIGFRFRA